MTAPSTTVIAFTGTRKGMTSNQRQNVITLLLTLSGDIKIGLHGDAIGADAEFDALCRRAGIPTQCYPSDRPDQRAYTDAEILAEPMSPLERNVLIVEAGTILLACPSGREVDEPRSGTWHTIRKARERQMSMIVINP